MGSMVKDDYEQQALIEATNLTTEQYTKFLKELEKIPTHRAPISGEQAVLCFELMEDAGTRVSETISIKKKDVDYRTRILTIMQPKSSKQCKCSRWVYRDQITRVRVLDYADKACKRCHGKGRWKAPQYTTITPRIISKLKAYTDTLKDDDYLFPVSRKTLWVWGKKAGHNAGINIFQKKESRLIEGIFLHLFRALCTLRMTRDAQNDPYRDQMISCKLRHSVKSILLNRYNRVDINYVLGWEKRTYTI